ncbi:MAG: Cytochrome c-type biogenesis protein CcmC, putative heme lyase for CcmE, partial [uncultured Gemmatimonadaceae bacterium]
ARRAGRGDECGVGARVHARRGAAGAGAEDLLRARAVGGGRALPGDRGAGRDERPLPLAQGRAAGPDGGERGRGGVRVHERGARDRADLGAADLGGVVDVGRAPHADALPLVRDVRLPRDARRGGGPVAPRALLRGARAAGAAARAVHPPERRDVPDAAPAGDRAQAERAVDAAGDGADVARGAGRVHPALRGAAARPLPLRRRPRPAGRPGVPL